MRTILRRFGGLLGWAALTTGAMSQPDLLWMEQFGTSADDNPHGLALDGVGGAYVAGWTKGDLGDPNAGGLDVFVARHDGEGKQLWIRQFGGKKLDDANAVAPDGQGGVFVTGNTEDSLGGPNAGGLDAYLVRYNPDGFPLWIKQFGTSEDDIAWTLVPDGAGGVFLGGHTGGDLGAPQVGGGDAYIARYDSDGNQLWVTQFGTPTDDKASSLAADSVSGVFVAGTTLGDLAGPNAGELDIYLARLDSTGKQLWTKQFGTAGYDQMQAAAPDGAGGVFVSGRTGGDLAGPNAGAFDAFLGRYDAAGSKIWLKQFGTENYDMASALAPDGFGGVFLSGNTLGDLAGPNAGGVDAIFARYDAEANQVWITQFGTSGNDLAYEGAIASDDVGNVFIVGDTTGDLGGPNAGDIDVFLAEYDGICEPDCDTSGTLNVFDFLCYINQFNADDPAADCDRSGALDLFDFLCFVNEFNQGC